MASMMCRAVVTPLERLNNIYAFCSGGARLLISRKPLGGLLTPHVQDPWVVSEDLSSGLHDAERRKPL